MKIFDKKIMLWKFYLHLGIVDLYVRTHPTRGMEAATYPLFSIDFLHGKPNGYAICATIPVASITFGVIL